MAEGRRRELVTLGDVTIDLVSDGTGRLLVLIPSKARDSLDFDPVAEGLSGRGFRVLRPQPRGALGSAGPADGVRLQDLAADVAHLIVREATGPAIVVGHAFGNWVARVLAQEHPHLVAGVVLAAAAAANYPPEQRTDVRTCSDPALPGARRLEALARSFFAPGHDPSAWLDGWHAEAARIQDRAVAASPRAGWWSAGVAPILDLIAEHDPFRPRTSWSETADLLGTARVTISVIPGASHALMPEMPEAVVEAISGWARMRPSRA